MSEKPPFDPNKNFKEVPQAITEQASPPPEKPAFDPSKPYVNVDEQYGGVVEQAKNVAEQLVSGATLGGSEVLETKLLRVPPENIKRRKEENPIGSVLSNVVGLGATLYLTGGLGAVAKASTTAGKLGIIGLEASIVGGATTGTDQWSQNKPIDAQKIAASAGIAGLLGLGLGAIGAGIKYKLGTPLAKKAIPKVPESEIPPIFREGAPVVSELDAEAFKAGEFVASVEHSPNIPEENVQKVLGGLKELKHNSDEIVKASENIGAPVLEGMLSSNKWVQSAEDALINGSPSYSGIKRQKLYQQVYDAVNKTADDVIGKGSPFTKAELGNELKQSIVKKIETQVAPLNALYDEIAVYYPRIPLSEKSAPAIARAISKIDEIRISPGSPEAALGNRVVKEIANLKTVNDVKLYKTILNRSFSPTASSGEKRMAGILSDKLSSLEERSIIRFAENNMKTPEAEALVKNLINQRKTADTAYSIFRKNLSTLSEQLGKNKVHGAQDAINFITERLTPEDLVRKLFSKNDSEFVKFFSNKFPEEMQLMRNYQKDVLREVGSKTGPLDSAKIFREVKKLQPEIRQAIFSPQELSKLKDAELVYHSIPKNFNPSRTSHVTALREFFQSPKGALIANVRDLGLEGFIKGAGPRTTLQEAEQAATTKAFQEAVEKTSTKIDKGIEDLFR